MWCEIHIFKFRRFWWDFVSHHLNSVQIPSPIGWCWWTSPLAQRWIANVVKLGTCTRLRQGHVECNMARNLPGIKHGNGPCLGMDHGSQVFRGHVRLWYVWPEGITGISLRSTWSTMKIHWKGGDINGKTLIFSPTGVLSGDSSHPCCKGCKMTSFCYLMG